MAIVALYITLCFLIGACAKSTGRDMPQWVLISVLVSPVFGGLFLLISYLMKGKVTPIQGTPSGMDYHAEMKKIMKDRYDL